MTNKEIARTLVEAALAEAPDVERATDALLLRMFDLAVGFGWQTAAERKARERQTVQVGLAFLCERIEMDVNRCTYLGVNDIVDESSGLGVRDLPLMLDAPYIFALLRGEPGASVMLRVTLRDSRRGGRSWPEQTVTLDEAGWVRVGMPFGPLVFHDPGVYEFELWANGERVYAVKAPLERTPPVDAFLAPGTETVQ